ncbi:AAA family ATPase [Streptomyces acidiscabies]|uniref:AAA family ATPase n=1 Tax=Streptomyces acidiscabies TaxID=42234 RepID=A0AAP6EG49_9ACTN|nr:AAA family ATPase [Streptomyces acidiscabies]MBP5937578.1 AAA family ATPase [Streptomyces sp. LBUM 1476]MBZ3914331.1 AAA family ATPase [Streptomyces acidiscabies]MDX2960965.1 AAA family ATPase [Streptomyces acidiscabies]MDX3017022.1 AAA family ATPase [Streptomyces acidiscabies]MDX3788973.1 AAA family ATPase [Streptomyces acidiscabies]
MEGPRLEEVRLTSFKSFTGQRLPLQDLTVLIGRNGSGKSNALDALMVLARLASGESVRDALDGPRGVESIRGGVEGCAPLGEDSFQIGCRVRQGEAVFDLDVKVEVRPEVKIVREELVAVEGVSYGNRRLRGQALLTGGEGKGQHLGGRSITFDNLEDRLLTSLTPLIRATRAGQLVHRAADTVLTALREVFLLDPVPHLMRSYVNERDSELRRSADNLSAVVARLEETEPDAFHRLTDLVAGMPEYPVKGVGFVVTGLGDVQLLLSESGYHGADHDVPARLLSDGMLRFLAFGTAFLSSRRHLVIEEIENGLYPTQAARVLDLMKEETRRRRIDVLFTTHSPALLNSLTADDHAGVIVCSRDPETGESLLTPLPELPGYVDLLAAGDLGDAVAKGRLPDAVRPRDTGSGSIEDFLRSL